MHLPVERDGGPAGPTVADLLQSTEWERTPLGPRETWSAALTTAVDLMAASGFPMSVRWGPDLVFLYNDAYRPILGDKHPHAFAKTFRSVWPEIWDIAGPMHLAILSGEKKVVYLEDQPFDLARLDGKTERAYFTYCYNPLPDRSTASGIGGVFCSAIENTRRIRAEAARRSSEERLQLAMTASGAIGVWDWDVTADEVVASPAFAELFNVGSEAAESGTPIETFVSAIHPDDRMRVAQEISRAVQDGGDYAAEYRVMQPDGSVRWVLARGRCSPPRPGHRQVFPGVVVDITERQRALLAVQETEARFRTVADSVPALMWMSDDQGAIVFANRWFETFGLTPDEIHGFGWRRLVVADDLAAFEEAFRAAFVARTPFKTDVRVHHASGEIRWLHVEGIARFDADGRFLGYTGCNVDVTDAKAAAEHLELLVGELNHRVKNTLATVQSVALQTLRETADPAEVRDRFLSRLHALGRAHDVITAERWDGAWLSQVVQRAIEPYEGDGRRFETGGEAVRLTPQAALAYSMALQELCTNAAKYGALSAETGRVAVSWSLVRTEKGRLLTIRWVESGGPTVEPPTRRGFGTRLIERSLSFELDADVRLAFPPTGVTCTIIAPLT